MEGCYNLYADKVNKINKDKEDFSTSSSDFFVFHAPYNKLVQKSFARLFLLDARRKHERATDENESEEKKNSESDPLAEWIVKPIEDTYSDRTLDGQLKKQSAPAYKEKLSDSNYCSKKVGNTYAASVFFGIASLIDRAGGRGDLTPGKKVTVFSYGSGSMATMYGLTASAPKNSRFSIASMAKALSLSQRLDTREQVDPSELDYALETRARMHKAGAPYTPVYPTIGRLFPGTYYLNSIGSDWVRTYSRVPLDATMIKDEEKLAPESVIQLAERESVSCPVTGKLKVLEKAEEGCDKISEAKRRVACVVTGVSAGLPGNEGPVFAGDNLKKLVEGHQCIKPLSDCAKNSMLEKNVFQLKKKDGKIEKIAVDNESQLVGLAAQVSTPFSLVSAYGVPKGLDETMDVAAKLAVAAGLEALKNAGLVSGGSEDIKDWQLPEKYRDSTGVVYASSFPAMDAAVGEVMKFLKSKTVSAASTTGLIESLRSRILMASPDHKISDKDEQAFSRLSATASEIDDSDSVTLYEFDRKFLFRVLVLGNAQLAQLAGCRGPNTQTNAACAGTTQAIGMAQDMLISGRAERVVVVAGDNASGETLLPWLASGFRALGAACIAKTVEEGSMPFDKRRNGMILGAGAIGMVLESEESLLMRQLEKPVLKVKARLLATQYSNSAYHGAALDRKHIAKELKRFLNDIEVIHGISKSEIAANGVYFSHETSTHASDSSSCSGNEVAALREAFGDALLAKLLILNTKGFTGHPMGVSFEDVTAIEVLTQQKVPPVVNYKEKDEYLGDLNLSKGGDYACKYALRFAAGFGSQVAFALYATASSV